MVQPENGLDHFSYPASIAQRQSRRNSTKYQRSDPSQPWHHTAHNHDDNNAFHPRRSDSGTKHLQGGDHMPRVRKTTRQFEKDKASRSAKHGMRSAGSAECQSTTPPKRTRATNHTILTTSTRFPNTKNFNSTQQASDQATPAATGSEATKTHQHQSAHSQDNG